MLFSSFRYGQYIIIALLFSLLNACGGGGNNLPETAPKDTIPPKIELIKPIPGSKVTTNSFVEITFNEEIQNYDTNNIQIRTYKNNIVDPNSTIALKTSDLSFSQKTLIVKPGILQSDKKYQVIVKEFRDIAGNMLKEQCQWDFATENYPGTINNTITGNCGNGPGTPDTTPPLIVNVNPATTSTPTTSSIIITFSEAIDTSTLDSNITLSEISANGTALLVTPMPYTLDNYNSTEFKVTLIPTFSPALKANTQYQITIKAGPTGIKDIQGNSLVTDSNTRFTTLADTVSDTTPPQVSGITPISDATVDPATNITVSFNEAMAPSTIQANITLSQIVNGSAISVKPLSNLFTYDYNNISNKATLTIVPGQFLAYQSQYEIRVTTGVKDKSGNALTADIKSLFVTTQQPDSTAPTILKVTPATGTSIVPTTNITITFSEKMDSTTLKPNIKLVSVNDIAATPLNNYSYNYNVTTKIVTFTPIQIPALLYGTKYQLLIKSGINGVKDISNNSLATNYTRNFTTSLAPDKTAPTVINVIPTEGSTVAASTDIKIYFSENMKETSLQTNFELYEVVTGSPSLITPFPFIVQYNQVDFIATLLPKPTIPTLLPGKNYRIIVKGSPNGVMDIIGNQLSADKPTNFSTAVASNQWSWIEGSNTGNAVGDYVLPNQSPGAREHAVTWTDLNGNFWLFGGLTVTAGSLEIFNDLWKFDGANWSFESGKSTINNSGVYSAKPGTASTAIYPGARSDSATWVDATGNLWLFGGDGYDSAGVSGSLNDLWKYQPSTKKWTWLNGSNLKSNSGSYSLNAGTALSTNLPPSRKGSSSWLDNTGNLWLFGGYGYPGNVGAVFNDVWKYIPGTNMWIWVSGSKTPGQSGVYTNVGSGVIPGSRALSVNWKDSAGNFWIFGGLGYDVNGSNNSFPGQGLNDIWKYNPTTKKWAFIAGSTTINNAGIYGTKGSPTTNNIPGARYSAVSWLDSQNNLWLWGGMAYDVNATRGSITDLWKFDGKNWTWMHGNNTVYQAANYGTKGLSSATTIPGSRQGAVSWTNLNGNLWLFGGEGPGGRKNDLWKYTP